MKYILVLFSFYSFTVFAQVDKGDLVYTFQKTSKFPVARLVPNSQILEQYRTLVNETIALPRDIPVTFCDCNVENAWYSKESHSITICYDYIQSGLDRMRKNNFNETDQNIVDGISVSVLGHELGHGLIHQLNLPTTGKDENAADEFSVVFMLKDMHRFYSPAFIGALGWYFEAKSFSDKVNSLLYSREIFADVHAPHGERYFNYLSLLCGYSIEGSNRSGFIGDDKPYKLPRSRAQRSAYEYDHAVKAWDYLLHDYYKVNLPTEPTPIFASASSRTQRINSKVNVEITPAYWQINEFNPPSYVVNRENYIQFLIIKSDGGPLGIAKKDASTPELDARSFMLALSKSNFSFVATPEMPNPPNGASKIVIKIKVTPN